jgi:hypothetical protein
MTGRRLVELLTTGCAGTHPVPAASSTQPVVEVEVVTVIMPESQSTETERAESCSASG